VGESIGQPEARYVHLGMTSSDVIDTAFAAPDQGELGADPVRPPQTP